MTKGRLPPSDVLMASSVQSRTMRLSSPRLRRWSALTAVASLLLAMMLAGGTIRGVSATDSGGNDASVLISEMGRLNNASLLWGPYRPNLYFGVRPRVPKALMTGLIWAKVDNYVDVQQSKQPHVPPTQAPRRTRPICPPPTNLPPTLARPPSFPPYLFSPRP